MIKGDLVAKGSVDLENVQIEGDLSASKIIIGENMKVMEKIYET